MTERHGGTFDEPVGTPRIEVTVSAPADEVWRALREPDRIRRWHGWQFEGLEEEVRVIFTDEVLEDPATYVLVAGGGDRFSLHPVDGGTLVRVTRAPRGSDPDWDAYYDEITAGWTAFLQQLRFGLERHALAERATVTLYGETREPVRWPELLGLQAVLDVPVGGGYRASLPTGDEIAGEVYARTPDQLALTVEATGPGLLVIGRQPGSADRPADGLMMLLTTYGLAEEQVDDLERRWTSWWDTVRAPDEGSAPADT